mmetsp:Transcript_3191/g.9072  ORF Transcript_3191/g.9072 Transcript_3191/m.9072 type:complete len:200 (+) Transcript_3191:1005-1604(+)
MTLRQGEQHRSRDMKFQSMMAIRGFQTLDHRRCRCRSTEEIVANVSEATRRWDAAHHTWLPAEMIDVVLVDGAKWLTLKRHLQNCCCRYGRCPPSWLGKDAAGTADPSIDSCRGTARQLATFVRCLEEGLDSYSYSHCCCRCRQCRQWCPTLLDRSTDMVVLLLVAAVNRILHYSNQFLIRACRCCCHGRSRSWTSSCC